MVDSAALPLAKAAENSPMAASLVVPSFRRPAGPLSLGAFDVPVVASEAACEVDFARIVAVNELHGEHRDPADPREIHGNYSVAHILETATASFLERKEVVGRACLHLHVAARTLNSLDAGEESLEKGFLVLRARAT